MSKYDYWEKKGMNQDVENAIGGANREAALTKEERDMLLETPAKIYDFMGHNEGDLRVAQLTQAIYEVTTERGAGLPVAAIIGCLYFVRKMIVEDMNV